MELLLSTKESDINLHSLNPDINILITWAPLLMYGDDHMRMAKEMEKENPPTFIHTDMIWCAPTTSLGFFLSQQDALLS